jgi:hypothetical protein
MSKSPLLVDSWIRNLAGKNLEISISLDRSSIHIDPQQKHLKPGCTIFLLIDNSLIKFNPQYFKIAESLTTSNNPIESALMWLNIPNYILVLRISLDIYICMPIFYHIWNILVYETYLKHIWNIYETYMKHIWNISETYLKHINMVYPHHYPFVYPFHRSALLWLHRALQCEGPCWRWPEASAQQSTGGGVVLHT